MAKANERRNICLVEGKKKFPLILGMQLQQRVYAPESSVNARPTDLMRIAWKRENSIVERRVVGRC